MRITALDFLGTQVTPKTNWCFLLVRTDAGLTGLGECTLANQEGALAAEAARLAAQVVGEEAAARNRLCRCCRTPPAGWWRRRCRAPSRRRCGTSPGRRRACRSITCWAARCGRG
ncbi:hypothetical protein [Teichococcus aestuarii]|uniref:hypothetical protein n=1 Tax=Teichococcus aestuarii TaxID=568898 RepID=UPI00361F07F4